MTNPCSCFGALVSIMDIEWLVFAASLVNLVLACLAYLSARRMVDRYNKQ